MNPITIVPSLTSAGIAAVALAAVVGVAWLAGDVHGTHKAELACANTNAAAIAEGVQKWQDAAEKQRAADAEVRAADQKRATDAANQAQAIADKFAGLRLAIVKAPPQGACTLSKEWLDQFNGAR